MMTSSNGNIFRFTGPLCGEFTGPGEFPTQMPVTRGFGVFFDLRLNKRLSNDREAGDLRRHRGHYDVNVIITGVIECVLYLSPHSRPRRIKLKSETSLLAKWFKYNAFQAKPDKFQFILLRLDISRYDDKNWPSIYSIEVKCNY